MINQKQTWGSHIPTNISLIKAFNISGVIELGAGYHSTGSFFDNCNNVTSIETDKEWVDTIKKDIIETETNKIVHYQMPDGIVRYTRRDKTNSEDRQGYIDFVIEQKQDAHNMLFVDCISSLRYDSVVKLHTMFDVVTFHDYQERGRKNHYCGGIKHSKDYTLYIDTTYEAHTGILVKKTLDYLIDDFVQIHKVAATRYVPGCKPSIQRG